MAMASSGNNDLWRECVSWLTRCKIIPPDHKANWSESEIRVLALTLRDGVLLCNLVIFLDPSSMDPRDFNRKPQMAQFLCCKNIKLFLDVCRNYFGIRESDLFEPTMLYDLTNFHRVLITLSKLSKCRKVQQLHPDLLGFNLQLSPSERSHSDEAIYKDLHSTESKKNDSIEGNENLDATSQSGSLSVDDENSDITFENGTEDTEDYDDDIGSASCEPIDEDKQSVHSGSAGSSSISVAASASTIMTPQTVPSTTARYTSASGNAGIARASSTSAATPTAMAATRTANENQSLQKAAAAAWNYHTTSKEDGNEYLNDIYFEEEEKVYEDLCYVTFSSKLPEVCINNKSTKILTGF